MVVLPANSYQSASTGNLNGEVAACVCENGDDIVTGPPQLSPLTATTATATAIEASTSQRRVSRRPAQLKGPSTGSAIVQLAAAIRDAFGAEDTGGVATATSTVTSGTDMHGARLEELEKSFARVEMQMATSKREQQQ